LPAELEPHVSSSMMLNILRGINFDSHLPLIKMAKSMYSNKMAVYLHLYGKEPKPGRKIGYITITGLVANITELEEFGQPLVKMASEIRQERMQVHSKTL
jgi:phosphoribosylaminoimidazole carboxylase